MESQSQQVGKTEFFRQPGFIGVCLSLFATAIWSGNFIVGRGLSQVIPPVTLAFLRWFVAFAFILPVAARGLKKDYPVIRQHMGFFCLISAIGIFYFNTALYWAAHTTPALTMSFLAMSSPLFTLLLSMVLFKERLTPLQLFGVAVVLFGVVTLLGKGDYTAILSLSFGSGELLVLSASLSFSIYTVLVRRAPRGVSSLSFLTVTFGLGMLMLFPFFLWEQSTVTESFPFTWKICSIFLYLGIGTSIIAFFAWGKAIQLIGPGKTSLIYYSLPLFCGVEAMLFLNEPVTLVHVVSGMCIIGGLLMATLVARKK